MDPESPFADVLEVNEQFRADDRDADPRLERRRGLAILICMDSRIDPLRMLGFAPGDAEILRHPGPESPTRCSSFEQRSKSVAGAVVRVPDGRCRPSYPFSDFTCCAVRCTLFFGLQFQIDWVGCVSALS